MRAARDEDGNTYYVPDNMTYKDWEKKYVKPEKTLKNNTKSGIISSTFNSLSDLIHPITDESIQSVSRISVPELNDETNSIICEQRKALLAEMQQHPIGTEGSVVIKIKR